MQIDAMDARIIAILDRNARTSAAAIGREVGLSRTAVQDRITRLERIGAIAGYRLDKGSNAGLIAATLSIVISERPCDPALRWIAAQPCVTAVYSLAGDIDAMAMVAVADLASLSQLNDRIAAAPFIASSASRVILNRY